LCEKATVLSRTLRNTLKPLLKAFTLYPKLSVKNRKKHKEPISPGKDPPDKKEHKRWAKPFSRRIKTEVTSSEMTSDRI